MRAKLNSSQTILRTHVRPDTSLCLSTEGKKSAVRMVEVGVADVCVGCHCTNTDLTRQGDETPRYRRPVTKLPSKSHQAKSRLTTSHRGTCQLIRHHVNLCTAGASNLGMRGKYIHINKQPEANGESLFRNRRTCFLCRCVSQIADRI